MVEVTLVGTAFTESGQAVGEAVGSSISGIITGGEIAVNELDNKGKITNLFRKLQGSESRMY